MNAPLPRFYEFGPFRLDVRERLLLREQRLVSLPLKVFETLLALVEHHGQILEKSRLVKRLWPDTHVGSRSLAQNIFTLRKVLGGEHAQFIETIPKRGYRFITPVKACDDESQGMDWRTHERAGQLDPVNDVLAIRLLAVRPQSTRISLPGDFCKSRRREKTSITARPLHSGSRRRNRDST